MTVATQTNRTSAVGSGAIGQEVPFLFPITATSDLLVKKRVTATGVETTLDETTNYTVEIVGDIGGTLTTVTAIELTEQIHIIRNTPKTQSLDLEQGGSFNAENIEDALDKNTKLAIENKDAIGKAITFPETDPSLTTVLPNAIDRASKNLTFDASGNVAASVSVEEGSVSFTTFGTNMAEATNALAAKAVINLDHVIDVRDYGAVGDGSTDDTTAIQNAATAAAGGTLFFPKGTWLITSAIPLSSDTMVCGVGWGSVIKTETLDIDIFAADTKVRLIFKDFKIDGNRKGDAVTGNLGIANINLTSCTDVLIENVYFLGAEYLSVRFNLGERHIVRGCTFDGAVAEGITAWGDFTIISNNHFVDCQYNAIVSRQSENITISGNTFENIGATTGDAALVIFPKGDNTNPGKNISIVGNVFHSDCYRPIIVNGRAATSYIENVTISNNTFLDALGTHMIEVNYAKGVVISNNICEDGATTRDIYIAIAEDVVIEGNICRNSVVGIRVHSLVDGIISNNLIDTASDSGIIVSGTNDDRITISGNRTKSCTNYGISVTNLANKLKVINNDDDSSGTPFAIAAVGANILVYGNTIDGNLTVAKTADPTTLNIGECGLNITNSGAGVKVELDLPAATIGLRYTFTSLSADEMHIDPNGTETIRGGGAGDHLILNAAGETVTLECVVAGSWEIISYYAWGGDFEA
jgi:hypothetical protein